jgi:hypothetical protein
MKILVYTVTDFKHYADNCIEMLFENIEKKDNVDFCVISNIPPPDKFKYKTIVDDKKYSYIGFLKYSDKVPSGYDAYVYLDSDIIYFGDVNDLVNDKFSLSIVVESLRMNEDWFRYRAATEEKESRFFKDNNGLNAGTFCFKDLSFLALVRSLYEPFISGDAHADARLEQSSYNYAVCKYVNFDFAYCFDLSSTVKLFASDCWFTPEKKLYHFCGFSNEMFSKFLKMSNFLHEKQRRYNQLT